MNEHRNPRGRYRLAMFLGSAVVALAIGGCTPPEPPQPTHGLGQSPSANSGTTTGYINSLQFNESPGLQRVDVWLECHPPQSCGGHESVHLRIVAEAKSHQVNWQTALHSGSGYVLSRIVNVDSVPFGPWNIDAHDTAYVWIGAIPGQPQRNVALFHREGASYSFIKFAASKRYCPGSPAAGPEVHVNHPPLCHTQFARTFDESTRLASTTAIDLTRALGHDQGLWQGCAQGCCETAFF